MANERWLVDANALLAEVVKVQALEPNMAVAKIIMLLTEAERVDAVEVVRCKDCKHSRKTGRKGYLFCITSLGMGRGVVDDDFCSCGERRTDNGTD